MNQILKGNISNNTISSLKWDMINASKMKVAEMVEKLQQSLIQENFHVAGKLLTKGYEVKINISIDKVNFKKPEQSAEPQKFSNKPFESIKNLFKP